MKPLDILIGCEESQEVCKAFRARGHNAFSCDLQEPSGGLPEYHLQMDVFEAIKLKDWDLAIFFPPCTFLSNSGVRWLYQDMNRWKEMIEGAVFFRKILNTNIPKVAVENPIQHKYAKQIVGQPQTQVIQPYMFGHLERKATCLWLKGLPELKPTNDVKAEMLKLSKPERERIFYMPPSVDRAKLRSKTFPGIARAMAEQWSDLII